MLVVPSVALSLSDLFFFCSTSNLLLPFYLLSEMILVEPYKSIRICLKTHINIKVIICDK